MRQCQPLQLLGTLALALMIAGCAGEPPKPTEFLGDYSALQPLPDRPGTLYYEPPGID